MIENTPETPFKTIELSQIAPLNMNHSTNSLFGSNFIPVDIEKDAAFYALANLYGNWKSAVREYIANAETACKEAAKTTSNYTPEIRIEIIPRENKFIIKDNGIGISAKVFLDVFRYYGRSRFGFDETTSGKWGFGVKSYVMLTGTHGSMLIETKNRETDEAFSVYARQKGYDVLPSTPTDYGTAFTIIYKRDVHSNDIIDAVENIAKYVEVPVYLTVHEGAKDEKGMDIQTIDRKLISMHTFESEINSAEIEEGRLAGIIPIVIKHDLFEIYANIVLRYGTYRFSFPNVYNITNVGFYNTKKKEDNVFLINMPIDKIYADPASHLSNVWVRIKREDGAQIPGTDIKLPVPTPDRDRLKSDELEKFAKFVTALIKDEITKVYENVHTIQDFNALPPAFKNLIIAHPESFSGFQSAVIRELTREYRFISLKTLSEDEKSNYKCTSLADILTNHKRILYSKKRSVKKEIITRFLDMNRDAAIIIPEKIHITEETAALTGICAFENEASHIAEEIRESDLLTPSFIIVYGNSANSIIEGNKYLSEIIELKRHIIVLRSSDRINPFRNIFLRDPEASKWAVMKTKNSRQYDTIIKSCQPRGVKTFFTMEEAVDVALGTELTTNEGIMTLSEIRNKIEQKDDVVLHHLPLQQENLLVEELNNVDFLYVPLSGNKFFLASLVLYDHLMEDIIKNTLFLSTHAVYKDHYFKKGIHADTEKTNLVILEEDNGKLRLLEIIPRCVDENNIRDAIKTRDRYRNMNPSDVNYVIFTTDNVSDKNNALAENNNIKIKKIDKNTILHLIDTPYNMLDKMHIPPEKIGLSTLLYHQYLPDALFNMLIYAHLHFKEHKELHETLMKMIVETKVRSMNTIYENGHSLHTDPLANSLE